MDNYIKFSLSCGVCYPTTTFTTNLYTSNEKTHNHICKKFKLNNNDTVFYLKNDHEKIPISNYSDFACCTLETTCPRKHLFSHKELYSKIPPLPTFYQACIIAKAEKKMNLCDYMLILKTINSFQSDLLPELTQLIKRIFMISTVWKGGMTKNAIDLVCNYCFIGVWNTIYPNSNCLSFYKNVATNRNLIIPEIRFTKNDYCTLIKTDIERVKKLWLVNTKFPLHT